MKHIIITYPGIVPEQVKITLAQKLAVQNSLSEQKSVSFQFPEADLISYSGRKDRLLQSNNVINELTVLSHIQTQKRKNQRINSVKETAS
jgi:hypothetical protein